MVCVLLEAVVSKPFSTDQGMRASKGPAQADQEISLLPPHNSRRFPLISKSFPYQE